MEKSSDDCNLIYLSPPPEMSDWASSPEYVTVTLSVKGGESYQMVYDFPVSFAKPMYLPCCDKL